MQAPLPSDARVLTSRIGRRMIIMIVVSALLPLAAFAWVALQQVSHELGAAAEKELHQAAKNSGMSLMARLQGLARELELARSVLERNEKVQPQEKVKADLAAQFDHSFTCLRLLRHQTVKVLFGAPQNVLEPLSARDRAQLADKPLLQMHPSHQRQPILRLLRQLDDGALLAADQRLDSVFDLEDLRASGAEVLVFTGDGEPLFGSVPEVAATSALMSAIDEEPASGSIAWQIDGEPHLAHYWRLFLRPTYGCDLLIVQSRATAQVVAPLTGFQWWFTLITLVALLLAAATGLVQIRRTLTPVAALQLATQRVAAGDLATPVPVDRDDELGELAQSFNSMIGQLRENIERRETTERELVAARDDALAAAHAKVEFITNVSHELRTPLTSILAYAELLTSFPSDDEAQRLEFLDVISEQAHYLTALIDKVLDLSVSQQWQLRPTDVAETVAAAVEALPPASRPRVRVAVAAGVPRAPAVHDRLVQLWSLLLDNACKFSPAEAPVDVRVELQPRGLEVAVADRGDGIAEEDLERIFEPFCQVGRDIMTAKARGVGLGLTLARNIVQRHGGRIEVQSRPGHGSTFTVLLPVPSRLAAGAAGAAAAGGDAG